MKARLSRLACVFTVILFLGASTARAEINVETIPTTPLFPGGSLEMFFPEAFHPFMPKILIFEGSLQNTSFTSSATINFWFDWQNGPTDPIFTSPVQTFTLGVVGSGTNAQIFSGPTALTYTIPYCPPSVSIHFDYQPPGDPERPVFVTGTFTHICTPEPVALLIFPTMVLMTPLALRQLRNG